MPTYVDRRHTNCYKWDSEEARVELPLWVADMDFKAAPAILDALHKRIDQGVFGYTCVPDSYYEAISRWFATRHGWSGIGRENTIYTSGVVPAVSAILRGVGMAKGRPLRVVLQTPAYNCFFSSLRNLECEVVKNPLVLRERHYEIDWDGLEQSLRGSDMLLLCNPHNPTGRVWTREEMERIAGMCHEHGVFVLSDEIHCEFAFQGHAYVPFATVAADQNYCVCTSPTKAFNIAGLQVANIYCPDERLRGLIDRGINIHEVCDINAIGMVALEAAYNESGDWLDETNRLIESNYRLLCDMLATERRMEVIRMEGTYLAWVDIRPLLSEMQIDSACFCHRLKEQQSVLLNPGAMYGEEGFVRINLATSEENVQEATARLIRFVEND